jgi:ubiquinone/menaquinone biosynthesis C-methylase UbiE
VARAPTPGDKRLVAYVVPNPTYDGGDGTEANRWSAERIPLWQELWEDTYRQTDDSKSSTFDTVGWNSSYTGSAIPAEEMRDWVDRTVDAILSLKPRRVLEIGCGTGLLLFRIAPHCESYVGTDFSRTALEHVGQELKKVQLPQVKLLQRTADQLVGVEPGSFDLVVVNSVVQYFPDVDYLARVLQGAVPLVKAGGAIFLGDIRSLPLLEAFHTAVELHKAPGSLSLKELRERATRRMLGEKELVLDPVFFFALQKKLPQISGVRIQPKRAHFQNEMTRFRYTVILDVQSSAQPLENIRWYDWSQETMGMAAIKRLLQDSPEPIGLRRVPNARVSDELAAVTLLDGATGTETVEELRQRMREFPKHGLDPEDVLSLQDQLPYDVQGFWSGGPAGHCDYVISRKSADGALPPYVQRTVDLSGRDGSFHVYANSPLLGTFHGKLIKQFRNSLQDQLPEYMVPADFVLIDKLPLTPSGKVNRKALPAPHSTAVETEKPAERPRTDFESAMAEIWSEILQLPDVGLHDNFLDLGGHSLLAMRVLAKVKKKFGITADPREVMANSLAQFCAICQERLPKAEPVRSGSFLRRITRAIAGGS